MVKPEDRVSKPACPDGITVMSVDELCQLGKDNMSKYPVCKPKAESMAVIMYTVNAQISKMQAPFPSVFYIQRLKRLSVNMRP
jgi:hypothetical protein